MTNWPGNHGPQGGYGGPNPVGGPPPPGGPPPGWAPPPAGPNWSGQGNWGPPPPFTGPPPKNRKPLIITLVAGAAVLLIAVIVAVIALAGGGEDGKSGTAGDVVKGYLEALARGDAEAALSYSDGQPGSKEFLTDEILKKQIEKAPITNIKILNDDSATAYSMGTVHVAVNFGDQVSDETLMLKRSGKEWKLQMAAAKVEKPPVNTQDKSLSNVTLFGKPLPTSAFYVFPGWLDIGTTNPNLSVTSEPLLLNGLSGYSSVFNLRIEVGVSDAGRKAAEKAVRDAIIKCTRSSALKPPSCPNGVNEPGAIDGSASWGQPEIPALDLNHFNTYEMRYRFSLASVEFPVSIDTRSGPKSGTVSPFVSGSVDMSQDPPVVTFG
ncbi:hypothetical protein [[Mycobacterium] wendilense]|uniref:DUF4878 domain-containing protein n=1 Tax=[Mycobacterium] wendilense TaxID=3064284 RepID=A0ABM9MFT7_9MYCO|nr:hypothetical protein [Mycolicibacterium sp. MU0050]CAJ1584135.1 hypothetical protein MU0050_003012 [Mycolicibacterium sp. MU0050]